MTILEMSLKSVDIRFDGLSYYQKSKCLLNEIDGQFIGGQLSGILGPSGAGKTTLLNVLAGHMHDGISGDIYINDKPRNTKIFHRISSYIMQEDMLQPRLSVKEMMRTAANLKLESHYTQSEKHAIILKVLASMGLDDCMETMTEHLSGGQKKRLCIALELVNNPPVIFLDEPTTGLDDVSTKQCIALLKTLAKEGKTIICTIHQPSNTIFELFDQVYFLSQGSCIYSGKTCDIVPFLNEAGMPCPEIYSPADFLIELVHVEKWASQLKLQNEKFQTIQQKEYNTCRKHQYSNLENYAFAVSFWLQFWVLLKRKSLQILRNKFTTCCEIGHHIICGFIVGLTFYQRGLNAKHLVDNIKLYYGIVIYIIFAHAMTVALTFPMELKLVQREYFNRWYNLKAYFLALNIAMLPVAFIGVIIFTMIVYWLSGQPLEIDRISLFLLIMFLYMIASQGFGLVIGSLFSPTNGACIGSAIGMTLILISSYNMGAGEITNPLMKAVMNMSYVYHGYAGLAMVAFKNRNILDCEDVFCMFSDPDLLLQTMGMEFNTVRNAAIYLVVFATLHRALSYGFLKYRLKPGSKLCAILN